MTREPTQNEPAQPVDEWWRRSVAYQVYVQSFSDSNGDGIGDLDGITAQLDSLEWLGIDVIWLSPICESPMRDAGYDVSNYQAVNPAFGDLDALDRLVEAAHDRQIRVLLDWVPNHTSIDHPWFIESASSADNPRRDWYVWVDEAGDEPPNNWQSCFPAVGSAWSRHPTTGHWYLHSFLREQADLNWDDPDVRAAAHDVMRFWLDRGIDGFRIDVVHNLGKDPGLADNPSLIVRPSPDTAGRRFDEDHWPNLWPKIEGIRSVLDDHPGAIAVGESYVLDADRLAEYTKPGRLHLAHDFTLTELDWDAATFSDAINRSNRALGVDGWPAWILSSHDHGRLASRWDADGRIASVDTAVFDPDRAEAALAVLILMRGTPFVFQGEELALPDATGGDQFDLDGRARSRTPLPWDRDEPSAGFSDGTPWMPIDEHTAARSRSTQLDDQESTLSFTKKLIALRRHVDVIASGDQTVSHDDGVLVIHRHNNGSSVRVLINMTSHERRMLDPDGDLRYARRAARSHDAVVLAPSGIAMIEA